MTLRLLACVVACVLWFGSAARAEDVASVRIGGGPTLGPKLAAWELGYGTSWDTYLDGGIGLRLGVLAGMLSHADAGVTPALLTLTPDVGAYFGKGADSEIRIYYTLELPLRMLQLSARVAKPDVLPMVEGVRLGAELQKPFVALDLRARLGVFAALQRDEHADVQPGVSIRLIFEYGPPVLPPPPKHDDRMCPDGKTWKLPGVECP